MQRKSARRKRRIRGNSLETLETRVLLAADWQNPIDAMDVNASGDEVSPIDALLVINELNSPTVSDPATGMLPDLENDPPPFVDVDGNGMVTPIDALLVVNTLNTMTTTSGTGSTDFQTGDSVIVGMPASHQEGVVHDTLVNTRTRSAQVDSDVGATLAGDSVIVWASQGQDGSGFGIFGQRYDNTGSKVGGEFQINETTSGAQKRPSVDMWDDGSFIVTWDSVKLDGSGFGIAARMFHADGSAATGEFQVNSSTRGSQTKPVVATSSDGESLQVAHIAWTGRGNSGVYWTTIGFGSTETSGEFMANSTTRGKQTNPTIAASSAGLVAISWEGRGVGDNNGIFMDVFGPDGESILGETLVNDSSNRVQRFPSISMAPRGTLGGDQIVVAWKTHDGEPGAGVRARQYSVDPVPDSGGLFAVTPSDVIQVNETTSGPQRTPSVAHLDDSTFIVSWFGRGVGDRRGVFSRQFAADGTPLSDESLVNATTTAGQIRPNVAAASNGYIITWQGNGNADHHGIFARFVDTEIDAPFQLDDILDITVNEGDTVSTMINVIDLDGTEDDVVFSFGSSVPAGLTLDANTGQITWNTSETDGGQTFVVNVIGTDANDFSDDTTFAINVTEVNSAPVIAPAIADQTVFAGQSDTIGVTATDPDGDPIGYSATLLGGGALPAWISINATTGTFTTNPQVSDAGTIDVVVTATDPAGLSDSDQFSVTVVGELGFAFNVPAQSLTLGDSFSIDLDDFVTLEGDTDPGVISFVIDQSPSWLSFDPTTNVLSGTPAAGDVGSTTVNVTATGANTGSATDGFVLTVNEVNLAPQVFDQTLRINPSAANGTVIGTVIGSDPNAGATLTYAITGGNDAGAFAIDANTGEISVADTTVLSNGTQTDLMVTATDASNEMGSGTVTVFVDNAAFQAGYTLGFFDLDGNEITSVAPGGEFELRLFSVDRRTGLAADDGGVFSAFADVVYDSSLVSVSGNLEIATLYASASSGTTTTPGLLDEVGGVDGLSPFGTDPTEVARIQMTAGATPGVANFATDFADDAVQHPTLVFGLGTEIPRNLVDYGSASLTIASNTASIAPVMPASATTASESAAIPLDGAAVATTPAQALPSTRVSTFERISIRADQSSENDESLVDQLFADLGAEL